MFTLPPRPPKDYELRNYPTGHRSSDVFTPSAVPRVTQTTIGKYCVPVAYRDDEVPEKVIEKINDKILEQHTLKTRAEWIDKPGTNDFFLHDMYKKYTVVVEDTYDPRFKQREKIFCRPFKFELDCMEGRRLAKLEAKARRENEEFIALCDSFRPKPEEPIAQALVTCDAKPPFWWKKKEAKKSDTIKIDNAAQSTEKDIDEAVRTRWANEPTLIHIHSGDCKRKMDMLMVGCSFKSEACNWYYRTYPPPNIKFRPQKFM